MTGRGRRWEGLIVHHSGGAPTDTVESLRRFHRSLGWADVGYHFVVERDREGRGHLKRGRSDRRSGAHAGSLEVNARCLGLCVVGTFHPGLEHSERMSEALYGDVVGAVVHVLREYGIPASEVRGHCEVRETACPGAWFPLERLKRDVARLMEAQVSHGAGSGRRPVGGGRYPPGAIEGGGGP